MCLGMWPLCLVDLFLAYFVGESLEDVALDRTVEVVVL